MTEKVNEFNQFRTEMNDIILNEGDLNTKRFFNLDTKVYQDGKIPAKTKELLGLVASMVLRCDDCVSYHIIEADKAGWTKEEIYEALNVALVVGGSIVIPHLRRAAQLLEELNVDQEGEAQKKQNQKQGNKYKLYTDGACLGNPGPGGYAAVILNAEAEKIETISGAEKDSTNNRMELKAVIEGLKMLPPKSSVELYSDSSYVLNGLAKWLEGWKKNGWKTASKKEVANQDLWQQLDKLTDNYQLKYFKVKGHSGDQYNEKVDTLAKKAAAEI